MDSKTFFPTRCLAAALLLVGCPADDDGNDTNVDDSGSEGGSETGACEPMTANVPAPNEAACSPLASDYPGGADYPDCDPDDGTWHTVLEDPPGSAARVDAYEMMMTLLRGGTTPDTAAFVAARMQYSLEEGLESRAVRREDLHYPEIDAADQMAGVDFDKQCTIEANVTKYPDRCAGPAKVAPVISAAFDAGMAGEGDPNVHAARIDAGVLWFLWMSTYKEASSCVRLPEDCDAHRGYYDGANPRESPKGLGEEIDLISPVAHNAVFDAMLGIDCWRLLEPTALLWEDYTPEDQARFLAAHEQLDNALFYAWARLVRDRLEKHPMTCGSEADASWAFIEIAGPVLDDEAAARDGAMAGTLSALWSNTAPTVADIEGGIAAIDAIFPCPQCESCEVDPSWGYEPIE